MQDLAEITKSGESETLEFKPAFNTDVIETAVAFANTRGGRIPSEDLLNPTHTSKPRNKLIAQVFFDMGIIERYGGGIQRILDHCHADNLPAPILENSQGGFRIIFQSATPSSNGGVSGGVNGGVNGGINEGVNELFDTISSTPGLRAPMLAKKLTTSTKNIERWLKQLKDAGKIEFRGSPKTGGYYPTKP